jgi:site-specific recombinase XerD
MAVRRAALFAISDRTILVGKRDYALMGGLFACGLRRAELRNLEVKTIGS